MTRSQVHSSCGIRRSEAQVVPDQKFFLDELINTTCFIGLREAWISSQSFFGLQSVCYVTEIIKFRHQVDPRNDPICDTVAKMAVLASFCITRAIAPVKAGGLLSNRLSRLGGFSRGGNPTFSVQPPLGRRDSGDSPQEKQERKERQQRHFDQKLKPVRRKYLSRGQDMLFISPWADSLPHWQERSPWWALLSLQFPLCPAVSARNNNFGRFFHLGVGLQLFKPQK